MTSVNDKPNELLMLKRKRVMNRNLIALLIVFSFLTIQCRVNNKYYYCDDACKKTHVYPKDIDSFPLGVKSLILAYPHFIQGYEEGYLIFRDGTKYYMIIKKRRLLTYY
jgi:hypothetical protein